MERLARISQKQFFVLCEEIRNQIETVKAMTSRTQVAKAMTEKLGYLIAEGTVGDALEVTGIELAVSHHPRSAQTSSNIHRTLCRAILKLHKELGITPDQSLIDLMEKCDGKPYIANQVNGVPVKEVPDPKKIKIANQS